MKFVRPVKGIDLDSGDVFTSDRHRVLASWARVNKDLTEFMNDDEEIIASWQTELIATVQWPTGKVVPANAKEFSSHMDEVKAKYPNAWSSWSQEEDQQLILEFNSGVTVRQCQQIHGRTRGGIISRLRRLGLRT